MKRLSLAAILCLLVWLPTCSSHRPPVEPQTAEKPADPYPPEFRMSHHALLTVLGKQYDFVGYLGVNRARDLRAVAFADMGGKLFDLMIRDGRAEVLAKPGRMPSGPLKRILRQMQLIFLAGRNVRRIESNETIELLDFRLFPGWEKPIPGTIVINDPGIHCRMKLELLSITPGELEPGLFSTR